MYRRLQRVGFYWPSMSKEADQTQSQCEACQMAIDQKESYAVFTKEDWRTLLLNIWLAASYRENMKASTSLKGW